VEDNKREKTFFRLEERDVCQTFSATSGFKQLLWVELFILFSIAW